MKTGDQLRLLVVEKSTQDAESLAAVLRGAGYSIEYSHVADSTSLQSQLNREAPDIVLCGNGNSLPSPRTVLEIIGQHGLTTPVIAIADTAPEDAIVTAQTSGISALVSYNCPGHLQLAVSQAVAAQHQQQRLATLEEALHNSEARCQTLLKNRGSEPPSRQDIVSSLDKREHFMELLEQCVSTLQEDTDEAALIYILLDQFKSIREEAGIAASDRVLHDIEKLIEDHAGANDQAAHFGEYAFTLLHRGATLEESRALGDALQHNIAAYVLEIEGRRISTTCSIGICAINSHSRNAQHVVSRADLACEVARSAGGNQVHTHSTAVDEQLAQDQEQHHYSVIRKTIDDHRFSLVFQPIASLKNKSGQYYEVLLRVVDESGHPILPGEFLSIAEKTGHSGEIDRWVINTAFRTLAEHRNDSSSISFYIKLCDATLSDAELPGWINQKLKEYRLAGDGVVFEIPEATAINNLKNSMVFVRAMQTLHCKVALEHYGLSDKSQLLKHLPVDVIKIDGSLIESLATCKENQVRVREIIELARKHSKVCIAEHVENANDLAILWQHGVDFIQGNFAQEPSKELGYEFEGEIACTG